MYTPWHHLRHPVLLTTCAPATTSVSTQVTLGGSGGRLQRKTVAHVLR